MKNNDIDKEKILSNADNADMETSVKNPMETPVETLGNLCGTHVEVRPRLTRPKSPRPV